jgi:hypothetical protein
LILSLLSLRLSATLVIMTDDAQWNYEFRGSYPDIPAVAGAGGSVLGKGSMILAKGKLGSRI